jgi:hypothetical protein
MKKSRPGFGVTPLRPAYGRSYKDPQSVKADWENNKDFRTVSNQYCCRSEFEPGHRIEIRYGANNEKLVMVVS